MVLVWKKICRAIKVCTAIKNVNLGKSSTMKARLQEEVRLVEIAQGTRVRYTEMGVFSVAAGNQLPNQL